MIETIFSPGVLGTILWIVLFIGAWGLVSLVLGMSREIRGMFDDD